MHEKPHMFGANQNRNRLNPHSKTYHKYITNIPQIYRKSTTKCDIVPQKCDIVPQKCDFVPQKGVVYYKM